MIRYPLEPLAAAVDLTVPALLRECGVSGTTAKDYRADGVTERVADRLACRMGLHPAIVWPDWMIQSAALASTSCAACPAVFVPDRRTQRYCSATCRRRAGRRRKLATERGREANRLRRRAYYEENADYEKARQRRYYEANADSERARQRRRYRERKQATDQERTA